MVRTPVLCGKASYRLISWAVSNPRRFHTLEPNQVTGDLDADLDVFHILVLEDDPKLNQLVCTYLNDSGFSTKGCLNVNDAYDKLYGSLYGLIISDIMMPETDGFEFAQNVRRVNRHIPILFMSARDDLPAKQKGFQLGIDDYMVKPIELDELLLRVRTLLRRANIETERKITVGNLVLDADAMTAEIDDEEQPITVIFPANTGLASVPTMSLNDSTGRSAAVLG